MGFVARLRVILLAVLARILRLPRLTALLVWLVLELRGYVQFRERLRRLSVPRIGERRGTLQDLEWLRGSVEHTSNPVSWSKATVEAYLPVSEGGKGGLWRNLYRVATAAFMRPRGRGAVLGAASPDPGEYRSSLTCPPTRYSRYALRTAYPR